MNTWEERVKSRMKELGLTQEMLAQKMGITRGAVTHYLAGRRVPPLKQFHKLAAVLKVDPVWLQYGVANITKNEKSIKEKKLIPLLSWQQAAKYPLPKNEIKEFVPHFYTDQSHWYALRIKGDAMTTPSGHHKSFRENDIIIVDSEKEAIHGSYIIALLPKSKEVTFKQLAIDGGISYLKPLNTQYPVVQIDKNTQIFGVVVNCICLL